MKGLKFGGSCKSFGLGNYLGYDLKVGQPGKYLHQLPMIELMEKDVGSQLIQFLMPLVKEKY